MILQAARYIFKLINNVKKGKTIPHPFSFINRLEELSTLKGKGSSVEDFFNLDLILDALGVKAAILIRECSQNMADSTAPFKVKDNELFA